MNDNDHLADGHPLPWRQIRVRSGVVIKDAVGATVLLLPFTGRASEERKARTAALILAAVNGPLDRDGPHPARSLERRAAVLPFSAPATAAPDGREAIRPRRPLPEVLTSSLRPIRSRRERVDPADAER